MPLIATRGASSVQGFGQFAQATAANYIEDMFSTFLWTGNDSSQTITNGIDLSTKGGLVWIKSRAAYGHILSDTNRGTGKFLSSNTTDAEGTDAQDVTAFNTTGFTVGNNSRINNSSFKYASWTFRKQPKFFDIVTYTGTGSNATISHNLGSEPGCIIVKRTDTAGQNWYVYHRGATAGNKYLILNRTDAEDSGFFWTPTSTTFNVSSTLGLTAVGGTYICYLFAHNAGGFGLTGTDNVISCGSFTTNGSGAATVSLGYEPQWLLFKNTELSQDWWLLDNMRGWPNGTGDRVLIPNLSDAEANYGTLADPTATGFNVMGVASSRTYIYIAIRRGPMKVPTTGTSVFNPTYGLSASNSEFVNAGFPIDLNWRGSTTGDNNILQDRLRGASQLLFGNLTSAESTSSAYSFTTQNGCSFNSTASFASWINWSFRRAPQFFDEVCYTGDNAFNRAITHNLTVVPELVITKVRSTTSAWAVYTSATGLGFPMSLNTTNAAAANPYVWGTTSPTSTNFYIGDDTRTNGGGFTYVSYFFATCAGVSKVGSYTGTGTTQTINCGFTAGSRFILIKRTDSTGDWYVWDSARGIIAGDDPYLLLNSTAAEVTGTDYVDTAASGFEISSTAPAAINANGGTFIFLAIA